MFADSCEAAQDNATPFTVNGPQKQTLRLAGCLFEFSPTQPGAKIGKPGLTPFTTLLRL